MASSAILPGVINLFSEISDSIFNYKVVPQQKNVQALNRHIPEDFDEFRTKAEEALNP